MGRPLFSTVITPAEPDVRVAEVQTPTYERWSYVNAFDPDADEFFEREDVVYEAFLTPEEVAQRERERVAAAENVRVQAQTVIRNRMRRIHTHQTNAAARDAVDEAYQQDQGTGVQEALEEIEEMESRQQQEPELMEPTEDDSSSSDGSSSGRVSPSDMAAEIAATMDARRLDMELAMSDDMMPDLPPLVPSPTHSLSLPATPIATSPLEVAPFQLPFPHSAELPTPSAPVAIPSPMYQGYTPMTPPGSVTPRFLHWSRPRAIDMSPSPTPDAPFGSARASRMAVSYIAPSLSATAPLRVQI